MIHNLNVFREKHRDRIVRKFRNSWFDLIHLIHLKRRFTWFVVAASIGMMVLLGYTISLFIDYSSTTQGFLRPSVWKSALSSSLLRLFSFCSQ